MRNSATRGPIRSINPGPQDVRPAPVDRTTRVASFIPGGTPDGDPLASKIQSVAGYSGALTPPSLDPPDPGLLAGLEEEVNRVVPAVISRMIEFYPGAEELRAPLLAPIGPSKSALALFKAAQARTSSAAKAAERPTAAALSATRDPTVQAEIRRKATEQILGDVEAFFGGRAASIAGKFIASIEAAETAIKRFELRVSAPAVTQLSPEDQAMLSPLLAHYRSLGVRALQIRYDSAVELGDAREQLLLEASTIGWLTDLVAGPAQPPPITWQPNGSSRISEITKTQQIAQQLIAQFRSAREAQSLPAVEIARSILAREKEIFGKTCGLDFSRGGNVTRADLRRRIGQGGTTDEAFSSLDVAPAWFCRYIGRPLGQPIQLSDWEATLTATLARFMQTPAVPRKS